MHWHSSHLFEILENTQAQVMNPWLTNEAIARQFIPKMKRLLNAWKEDIHKQSEYPSYTWPRVESYDSCKQILEVCFIIEEEEEKLS